MLPDSNAPSPERREPPPAISVLMGGRNVAPWIGEAIDSILNQTFADFELIVVDDRSTDGTGAIIADRAGCDRRVRVLHDAPQGRVPSLNAMLAAARAPLVAIMDSDDVAEPLRFAVQFRYLQDHPEIGALGTQTSLIDQDGNTLPPGGTRPLDHAALMATAREGINLANPSVLMRTDLIRAVGGWRPAFPYAQDYDLLLRLSERTRLANLPDTLLRYRIRQSQISKRNIVGQALAAALAWLSHEARAAGRPDPVDALDGLPEPGSLDRLFGRADADACARARIMRRIKYAPEDLAGEGLPILLQQAHAGGEARELWRFVLRLLRAGHLKGAVRLGSALVAG